MNSQSEFYQNRSVLVASENFLPISFGSEVVGRFLVIKNLTDSRPVFPSLLMSFELWNKVQSFPFLFHGFTGDNRDKKGPIILKVLQKNIDLKEVFIIITHSIQVTKSWIFKIFNLRRKADRNFSEKM